jgi:NOL1/NOP2/fmu family ribosome biogenesis protein
MQSLKFLNSKEKRDIIRSLADTYGFSGEMPGALLLSTKEQRIYLLSGAELLADGADKELRIDKAGLYIGKILSNGIQLSVEGCQLVGPSATKHILLLSEEHLEPWVRGEDIAPDDFEKESISGEKGIFIVKHGNDFLGSAIIKDGKIANQLSKNRRVKNLNR